MTDIHAVRRLNNSAATSLVEGDLDTALGLMHLCLQDMRMDLARVAGTALELNAGRSALDPLTAPLHQGLCRNDLCVSPNNAFHVFMKAFILPETEADFDAVAVVLMYNFGLGLQRKGIISGDLQSLGKAQKIYMMATNLLEIMEERGRNSTQVVAMGLWNNVGHLHSHFLDFEGVNESRERIRHYLSRANDLSAEDLLFFHQTVLFLDNCNTASRAPAA